MNPRRRSLAVDIGNIVLGAKHPIRIQSMTDTVTSDIDATVRQSLALAREGSELIRLSVLDDDDALSIPEIRARLADADCHVPLVGDFHFNGHALLRDHPACARALDKYRINPGNLGFGESYDAHFARILEIAGANDKAIRIGANWGSLDDGIRKQLLSEHSDWSMDAILEEAMIRSTLESAAFALKLGFPANRIVLSAKVSHVPSLLAIYRQLAHQTDLALHVGLTEAGTGEGAIIASAAALSILLQEGIGDTLRVSITPRLRADASDEDPRLQEVRVCQQILQANGLRNFAPTVRSCPGCGRTHREVHRPLVHRVNQFVSQHAAEWRHQFPGSEDLVIAVMGCVVNGIKEAKHAHIGISLPGRMGDSSQAMLFSDGKPTGLVQGENPGEDFVRYLQEYVKTRFSSAKNESALLGMDSTELNT